jgi:hypothetical protein
MSNLFNYILFFVLLVCFFNLSRIFDDIFGIYNFRNNNKNVNNWYKIIMNLKFKQKKNKYFNKYILLLLLFFVYY